MPTYSIIVPVFNSARNIFECINSILKQSVIDFELIIIDDGSTDSSIEILEEVAITDKRIVLLKKENGGVSSARNKGLNIAQGEYILFVDSDDYIDSDYLQTYHNLLQIHPDALIYQGFVSKTGDVLVNESLPEGVYFKDQITNAVALLEQKRCLGGACNKIFNADIINLHLIRFNENFSYGEDKIFTLEYLQYVDKILLSDKCNYYYNRSTEDSLSKKHHQSKELLLFSELEYKLFFKIIQRYPNEELLKIIKTRYSSFSKYVLLSMYRKGDFTKKEDRAQLRKKIINFEKKTKLNKAFDVEVPQIINLIYKYDFLMSLAMSVKTKFSSVYNFFRK